MTLLISLLTACAFFTQIPEHDILIRNGAIYDGSGLPAFTSDVAIDGDRITAIGSLGNTSGKYEIDATGLIIAPGFIDPHTHYTSNLSSSDPKSMLNCLKQGVTTVIVGNDGGGSFEVSKLLDKWEKKGIGTNAGLLVGHGYIRRHIMELSDKEPTAEQLTKMKALVAKAMDEGAFGLSSGLFYVPGSYAKTEEVIELAKVAAEQGGIYDTHTRDESSYTVGLIDSVKEAIRIGREANIPVNISHIKALGTDVWGKSKEVIRLIKDARAEGIQVTADQYPYPASLTGLDAALIPRWAQVGGKKQFLERLEDSELKKRILKEMKENLRRRGGPESLLLRSEQNQEISGKTLGEVAKQWDVTPIEATLRISRSGGSSVISFNMNEDDVENFMQQDFVLTSSDGGGKHPRTFGSFARKIRYYVYEKKLMKPEFAVRASSALTAEALGIDKRGMIRPGYFADVIVFDKDSYSDRATFEKPSKYAEGIHVVIINGRLVIQNGQFTGVLAGRPLRKESP